MRAGAARVLRTVLGDYAVYRILSVSATALADPAPPPEFCPVDAAALSASADELMREQAWYLGDGASAYGWRSGQRIVGACIYWYGARYQQRNFWPLADGQAKLVQIVTVADMRGRGIARQLIEHSARSMKATGFQALYARIWYSNRASLAAFRAAGWHAVSTVVVINPLRRKAPWRFGIGAQPAGDYAATRTTSLPRT